jgi:hypothetical protein
VDEIDFLGELATDSYSFLEIVPSMFSINEAQAIASRLVEAGYATVDRVEEHDASSDRPVSSMSPAVRSTSRLMVSPLSSAESDAVIRDRLNWQHTPRSDARIWYQLAPTAKTEAAFIDAYQRRDGHG